MKAACRGVLFGGLVCLLVLTELHQCEATSLMSHVFGRGDPKKGGDDSPERSPPTPPRRDEPKAEEKKAHVGAGAGSSPSLARASPSSERRAPASGSDHASASSSSGPCSPCRARPDDESLLVFGASPKDGSDRDRWGSHFIGYSTADGLDFNEIAHMRTFAFEHAAKFSHIKLDLSSSKFINSWSNTGAPAASALWDVWLMTKCDGHVAFDLATYQKSGSKNPDVTPGYSGSTYIGHDNAAHMKYNYDVLSHYFQCSPFDNMCRANDVGVPPSPLDSNKQQYVCCQPKSPEALVQQAAAGAANQEQAEKAATAAKKLNVVAVRRGREC